MTLESERTAEGAPAFDESFRRELARLFAWRRDVRRFRSDPLPEGAIEGLMDQVALAPSVGLSQPWRFVSVEEPARRRAVIADFERCNAEALKSYRRERAGLYARLKLAGLVEAPVHLAVFCDEAGERGHGLGQRTMPEMRRYSVVTAVHTLWLAARAAGIGVGWVSILDPEEIARILEVPAAWRLVAYLCLGHPLEESAEPELQRQGWERRAPEASEILRR